MEPQHNQTLGDARLQTVLQALIAPTSSQATATPDHQQPPPSYYSVVDPTAPIPNMHSPYDPESDYEDDKDDETPDITINAATQIRGNGNIISITQMDSVRIANLIGTMLYGPQAGLTKPAKFPKFNITVNCGATVIGERNIVGPGLGDIARQMQVQQRNQALQAQAQAQARSAASATTVPGGETVCQQVPSPPLSPAANVERSEGGLKRKAEDNGVADVVKRQC